MLTYIKNSRISCIYVLEQCINAAIKRPPGTLQHVSTQQEYGLKLDSSSLISIPEDISWTKLDHPKIEQENGSMLEDISCLLDNYINQNLIPRDLK